LVKDNKKRGLITSSTLIEASPNALQSYTSKSPRRDVSVKLLLLIAF